MFYCFPTETVEGDYVALRLILIDRFKEINSILEFHELNFFISVTELLYIIKS
jgi:hypothetical protein